MRGRSQVRRPTWFFWGNWGLLVGFKRITFLFVSFVVVVPPALLLARWRSLVATKPIRTRPREARVRMRAQEPYGMR